MYGLARIIGVIDYAFVIVTLTFRSVYVGDTAFALQYLAVKSDATCEDSEAFTARTCSVQFRKIRL